MAQTKGATHTLDSMRHHGDLGDPGSAVRRQKRAGVKAIMAATIDRMQRNTRNQQNPANTTATPAICDPNRAPDPGRSCNRSVSPTFPGLRRNSSCSKPHDRPELQIADHVLRFHQFPSQSRLCRAPMLIDTGQPLIELGKAEGNARRRRNVTCVHACSTMTRPQPG
ncbi:hypothetical protein Bbelb_355640 [Branchiostoma belcheri]|nr:hypothetical protein Bbelb_355640 [Branchiostoma belcheri]